MNFYKAEKIKKIDYTEDTPLVVKGRDYCIVHNDTDSSYLCIHELRERLIKNGVYSTRETKPFLTLQDGMSNEQIEELKKKNEEILKFLMTGVIYPKIKKFLSMNI